MLVELNLLTKLWRQGAISSCFGRVADDNMIFGINGSINVLKARYGGYDDVTDKGGL